MDGFVSAKQLAAYMGLSPQERMPKANLLSPCLVVLLVCWEHRVCTFDSLHASERGREAAEVLASSAQLDLLKPFYLLLSRAALVWISPQISARELRSEASKSG